jgi:transcriptional antiterminator NusG
MYYVIRVTSGQEKITADILENKVTKSGLQVYSIMLLEGMRGYLIVESADEVACRDLITNEPRIKGMLPKPLGDDELSRMLVTRQQSQEIKVSDIVEFMSGPFKGYKAKVIKFDQTKEEITVELMDVAVPIPVTTKANTARIIERAKTV